MPRQVNGDYVVTRLTAYFRRPEGCLTADTVKKNHRISVLLTPLKVKKRDSTFQGHSSLSSAYAIADQAAMQAFRSLFIKRDNHIDPRTFCRSRVDIQESV